jgi:hypothetical protein
MYFITVSSVTASLKTTVKPTRGESGEMAGIDGRHTLVLVGDTSHEECSVRAMGRVGTGGDIIVSKKKISKREKLSGCLESELRKRCYT